MGAAFGGRYFVAGLCPLAAFDIYRWRAGGTWRFTTIESSWLALDSGSLDSFRSWLAHQAPEFTAALGAPVIIVIMLIAALLRMGGRRGQANNSSRTDGAGAARSMPTESRPGGELNDALRACRHGIAGVGVLSASINLLMLTGFTCFRFMTVFCPAAACPPWSD
jgi:hypothetical protein